MSEKTAKKVIAIENLSKSFGDHQVLRKIDFAVEKGEVICIVGSSGSGNLHCYAVSISLNSRQTARFTLTARRLQTSKKKSMNTAQR